MNTKKFYTLNLKLKRHGLQFQYDENTKTFEIGKFRNAMFWGALVYGLMLFVTLFAIALTVVQFTGLIGFVFSWKTYIFLMIGAIAINIYLFNYSSTFRENTEKKFFTESALFIKQKEGELKIPTERIDQVFFAIKEMKASVSEEDSLYQGRVFLRTVEGNEYMLLSIQGEDMKILKDDLQFIQGTIQEYWNLQDVA